MAAVNSLILIGNAHPNDGGNRAFAEISQECGDRPLLYMKWKKFFKNTEIDVLEILELFRPLRTWWMMLFYWLLMPSAGIPRYFQSSIA